MAKTIISSDWVKRSVLAGRVERIEAYFGGHGYSAHRHDTYAIGVTLSGVQSFSYRGAQRHSLAGTLMVLHPDELHDGQAGTEAGFHYRMAYVEPALIQQVLGGRSLPFVESGLSGDPRLRAALMPLLQGMEQGMQSLEQDDALYGLAQALAEVCRQPRLRRTPDFVAVQRARAYIHDCLGREARGQRHGATDSADGPWSITLDALAQASGLDRWRLCRDFRALLGTSPYRYICMRRLDAVRALMLSGQPIAEAALRAGFFDQSHMARQFTQAYGVPPARWLRRLGLAALHDRARP